jgi:DNA repair exonuclease SbcCD ATPase subunit
LINYKNKVNEIVKKVNKVVGRRDELLEHLKSLQISEEDLKVKAFTVLKAKELLELFVKSTENQVKQYIEPTITEALSFVFNQKLYFHIVFVNRRGQVEVDFIVLPSSEVENKYQSYLEDNVKYEDELDTLAKLYSDINYLYGGAVQEILGLMLRLLLVELLDIKGPVFLDEPTSSTHEEYANRVGIFIKSLSERFNRQIIYITHSQAMASAANKVYQVVREKEISQVEEI